MKSPINKRGKSEETALVPAGHSPAHDPTFYLPKVEPSRFIDALLRRGWIILLFGLLAGVAGWSLVSKMPKTYVATGSIYVSTSAPQVLEIQAVATEESRDLEQLHSVEQDLYSTTVLLRVIEKHGLLGDSSFSADAKTEQEVLGILADRVSVELVRGSRNIAISVKDTDPERARQLVESMMSEYEAVRAERMEEINRQAGIGLASEEALLRERMEASAKKIEDFRKENAVPGLDDLSGGGNFGNELSTLSSQLTQAKSERMRLESEFEAFQKFDGMMVNRQKPFNCPDNISRKGDLSCVAGFSYLSFICRSDSLTISCARIQPGEPVASRSSARLPSASAAFGSPLRRLNSAWLRASSPCIPRRP